METRQWSFVDKSKWGEGEWHREPDKVQWEDKETGFPCLAVRSKLGNWCGYVGVSKNHPFFEIEYSLCVHGEGDGCESHEHYPGSVLEVHGGITFSGFCAPEGKEHGICHIVGEGEDDKVWWFGFDCGHACDLSPGMKATLREVGIYFSGLDKVEIYRNLQYVKKECLSLARQLKRVENDPS